MGVTTSPSKVVRVSGTAITVPGNDIDTDRIMPARFLKAVTFEGLEKGIFKDDRQQTAERGLVHPFDDAARSGARILIVGSNFGCGSSREHAPQALVRWGIPPEDAERLRKHALDPSAQFTVDLSSRTITTGGLSVPLEMSDATREALMSGAWDATGMLLADYDQVKAAAARLPYLNAFN
jgi:3-isopropylmalate/(R)-2-methylmalate dehydratase small subunit